MTKNNAKCMTGSCFEGNQTQKLSSRITMRL